MFQTRVRREGVDPFRWERYVGLLSWLLRARKEPQTEAKTLFQTIFAEESAKLPVRRDQGMHYQNPTLAELIREVISEAVEPQAEE